MAKEITRNRCLPARGPVGGERTASCAPARGPVARGPVGGERTASCVPARGPVGGERTAFSMLPRRFRDSRRLEAWLKGRKRKMLPRRFRDSRRLEAKTGRARRCFTDLFYGFRKRRRTERTSLGRFTRRSRIRLGKAVAKEITGSRCQLEDPCKVRERLLYRLLPVPEGLGTGVYQPEDPWEGRERLLVTPCQRTRERTAFSRLPSFTDLY